MRYALPDPILTEMYAPHAIGYGNIAPTQTFGRYFMIVYALVGIPVNGILYAYLGDYFGETVSTHPMLTVI